MNSNTNICLSLTLIGILNAVSMPLFAEVIDTPPLSSIPQIAKSAKTSEEHKQAAEIQKQRADYHKAMAEYDKSLAREYKNFGNHALHEHYEKLVKLHNSLSKEHAATALTHENDAKGKYHE